MIATPPSRLGAIITQTAAREIWCLGDNFHDDAGPERLEFGARDLLRDLTQKTSWSWITGNHDAHLPSGIGGTIMADADIAGVLLRHEADPEEIRPEISGHFHPKFRAKGARGGVTRPCFVAHETKIIMPSFGALTGGLAADHPAILTAMARPASACIPARDKLLHFPLSKVKVSSPKP